MTELPALSFEGQLARLADADEFLSDPNFDPAKFVGDLRDKVDGLKSVESRMQLVAEYFDVFAKPILEKAKTLRNNRERLRDYIVYSMQVNHFEAVPGNLWKVRPRANTQVSVIESREPTKDDFVEFHDVIRVKETYSWDKDAIKAKHANTPAEDMEGLPFKLVQGYWPEFVPNVPEVLEKKKRKKRVSIKTVETTAIDSSAAGIPETRDSKGVANAHESGPDGEDSLNGASQES